MTSSSSDTTSSSVKAESPQANNLDICMVASDPSTIKKGVLWQQRDRFFSRWKERYFVLTKDYLACFKKGSKVAMSEMGSFIYKLNLVEVDGLNWADKKRDGVIAIRVGSSGQLLLWSSCGLDEWMFALRESVNRSKGRREALRKSQTLLPSMTGAAKWHRQKLSSLHYTLSDCPVGTNILQRATSGDFSTGDDPNRQLRSTIHHNPTPVLNRREHRISVLTNVDLSFESAFGERRSMASNNDDQYIHSHTPLRRTGLPRLAPQCGGGLANFNTNNQTRYQSQNGSQQSLSSLGRNNTSLCAIRNHLSKPCQLSLQVSPSLAQRSLYAQHILGVNTTDSRHHQNVKSALKTATSEFSFIRPDSPLTLPHNIPHSSDNHKKPHYYRSQSCLESQRKLLANNTTNCVNLLSSSSTKLSLEKSKNITTRPSSIYGQPSFTDKPFATNNGNQNNYYCPSDAVHSPHKSQTFITNGNTSISFNKFRDTKSMPKRQLRHYQQSNSDSVFATTNMPHSLLTSNGPLIQVSTESITCDKLFIKHKVNSEKLFAVT